MTRTTRPPVPCGGPTCGAPILWAATEHEQRVPLEPEPILCIADARGPVRGFVLRDGIACPAHGRPLGRDEPHHDQEVVEIHESHFANCPDRELFRGRHR